MRSNVTEADHVLLGRILPEGVASAELFTIRPVWRRTRPRSR